jgi:hypothetical protein
VLYFVLWLPGLIANIVYGLNARRDERLIGRAPDGKGCLVAMLWVFVVLPVVAGLLVGVVLAGTYQYVPWH